MAHRPTRHRLAPELDVETAASVASTLHALANPGRLRILSTLQTGPATVGRLTESLGMEQSAVSHQLRLLRDLGFVTAARQGRNIEYRLYDSHIGELIDQAISHAEHVRLGVVERESAAPSVSDA